MAVVRIRETKSWWSAVETDQQHEMVVDTAAMVLRCQAVETLLRKSATQLEGNRLLLSPELTLSADKKSIPSSLRTVRPFFSLGRFLLVVCLSVTLRRCGRSRKPVYFLQSKLKRS